MTLRHDGNAHPTQLTVIYDPDCELCRRCKGWMISQPQLVPILFTEATNPAVLSWAGRSVPVGKELVVVSETGLTWSGADAFLVCLWALKDYRTLANTLQRRGLSHVARKLFLGISHGRSWVSPMLGTSEDVPVCGDGACT